MRGYSISGLICVAFETGVFMITRKEKLLKSSSVWEEIDRYKWIESERVGYDIGLENAVKEWINRYADAWNRHHTRQKVVRNRVKD